jgi:hypothetical protein
MFSIDNLSYKVVAAKVTRLADNFKIEYGYWPKITQVYYASASEGILPRTLESLRIIRRIAISGTNDHLPEWIDFQ